MYNEDDLLAISGLQHLAFCPRQWALIHVERLWAENRLTAEGRQLHDRAHSDERELRGDTLTVRSLRLHSFGLGLAGVADIVEFKRIHNDDDPTQSCQLPGLKGRWRPEPVEYKRGRPKKNNCDAVQLCAQAICLEEMLGVTIASGSLYYGKTRHRTEVIFNDELRTETSDMAKNMHELFESRKTPTACYEPKCNNCSLYELCQPKLTGPATNAAQYLIDLMRQ